MKNKILMVCMIVITFSFASDAYAASQNGNNEIGAGSQVKMQDNEQVQSITVNSDGADAELQTQQQAQQKLQDGTETGNQVQSQGQVKNQGEKTQIQSNEQSVTQNGEKTGSAVAEQRKKRVANAVQELLQVGSGSDEIGQQVKIIAQTQTQNQEILESSLQKIQKRGIFAKFFVGPNYSEINSAKEILEENKEQLKQLSQVKDQLTDQDDVQILTQQIQTLEQADLEIENSLGEAQKGISLLGWMFKIFSD